MPIDAHKFRSTYERFMKTESKINHFLQTPRIFDLSIVIRKFGL